MKFQRFLAGVAAVSLVAVAAPASAAVITSGGYSVGIGADGELYDAGAGVGFQRADGYDPIAPGASRDSWGLNTAYADGTNVGSNVTSVVSAGADSAVVTTDTGIGFTVEQTYSFVGNILKIETVVTNETLDALSAIFQRDVDFNIGFDETVFGPTGASNGVIDSSYFGLEQPDAATPYSFSCKFGCNTSGDLGAGIKINLGTINAGASRIFTYYYGLNREGTDVNALIGDAQAAGAKYIMAATANGGGGDSAIIGVSGAVPEPATWAMMLLGFFSLGAMVRRRRVVSLP